MERQQIVDIIAERLRTLLGAARSVEIGDDRDLGEFAEFDSVAIIETLAWLEERFEITISDEDLVGDRFASVGNMADYVIARIEA